MHDPSLHRALGLTDDEAGDIAAILGRWPNDLELAMYSVMWSEHCSYKSSRRHLGRLPTEAPWVLVGPGENAGVVDLGGGIAAAIRIESHNHPSAIEPVQGAATGVGGIIRDIFTMGARPVALMDALRFGPLDDARSRWIAEGVVRGIAGYGNAVGVPTVGGETVFDPTFTGNPLVNVLCLGLLPVDRLVLGRATGVGNLAVLLGSHTGRDGIGGVSVLASAGFGGDDSAKRPSVQVGDPFEEKRLIEACLALLDEGLVVGIQDLGGAGLTCATSETASRGGVGMDVDVSAVPRREPGMSPVEVMTSESQERMLAIVAPDGLDRVIELCDRWEVTATVVGRVTASRDLRVLDGFDGPILASVPAASLHDAAPNYDRPRVEPDRSARLDPEALVLDRPVAEVLASMLADTTWISSQYDHMLFCNTVVGPGSDATLLRLKHPVTGADTGRGMALSVDGNHRWCAVDPRNGTARLVAEACLNVACVGARPLAVVNNLNFGNPEHPEVMWQLSEAIDGMAEACRALAIPVVGGNVSLYNESQGVDIDPTPVIGVLGLVDRLDDIPPGPGGASSGDRLVMFGPWSRSLAGSSVAYSAGFRGGVIEPVDFAMHARVIELVRRLVSGGLVTAVHDIADGGLGQALAEMAVAGGLGMTLARIHDHIDLFAEGPSRCVVTVSPDQLSTVERVAAESDVPAVRMGLVGGDRVSVKGLLDVSLDELTSAATDRLPAALGRSVP